MSSGYRIYPQLLGNYTIHTTGDIVRYVVIGILRITIGSVRPLSPWLRPISRGCVIFGPNAWAWPTTRRLVGEIHKQLIYNGENWQERNRKWEIIIDKLPLTYMSVPVQKSILVTNLFYFLAVAVTDCGLSRFSRISGSDRIYICLLLRLKILSCAPVVPCIKLEMSTSKLIITTQIITHNYGLCSPSPSSLRDEFAKTGLDQTGSVKTGSNMFSSWMLACRYVGMSACQHLACMLAGDRFSVTNLGKDRIRHDHT